MAFNESDFSTGGPWGLFWPGCCCEGEQPPQVCLCMGVAISGLASGTCSKFGNLVNHTHFLPWVGGNTWQCVLSNTCNLCGDETLTLSYDAVTGIWTFTVAGIVWTGEGEMCDSISLTYESDTGYLDGSGSSIGISPVPDAQCGCWCNVTCEYPCGGSAAPYLAVTISDLEDGDSNTCTLLNGTWVIEWYACGQDAKTCWCKGAAPSGSGQVWSYWRAVFDDFDFLGDHPVCDWQDLRIEFYLYFDVATSKWYIKLALTPNSQTTGCSGCSFGVFFSREVTSEVGGMDDGDCTDVNWTFFPADACLLDGSICCDILNLKVGVSTL